MAITAYCCKTEIVLSEEGVGLARKFDCVEFMKKASPQERLNICQQLFNADKLCPDIAPYCEPFKDQMQRERSRKRDNRELVDPTASPFGTTVDAAIDAAYGAPFPGFGEVIEGAHDTAASVVTAAAPYRDAIHAALDAAGLIPVLGVAADGANAIIYAAEGDWPYATISAIAMVAVIGDGATLTRGGVKISKEAAERLGAEGLSAAIRDAKAETAAVRGVPTGEMIDGVPVMRYPPNAAEWTPEPIVVRDAPDPHGFDSVGTTANPRVSTAADYEVLEQALTREGMPRPPGHAPHHIVPAHAGGELGDRAREILAEAGIDINDARNGIWLPWTTLNPGTVPDAWTTHNTLHTTEYIEQIVRRLEAAAGDERAVADALSELYGILLENPKALSQ